MIELTVSRKKKVNTGKYENEEVMAAVKAEFSDRTNIQIELEQLNELVKGFVEKEAGKVAKNAV